LEAHGSWGLGLGAGDLGLEPGRYSTAVGAPFVENSIKIVLLLVRILLTVEVCGRDARP
jgi:hypothetical protein